jgi:hypothetical protein
MKPALILSLTISVALVMGIASMWCLNYGLGRESRAQEKLAYNEVGFGTCIKDVRNFEKIKGFSKVPMDKCPDIMAGRAVL